MISEAALSAYRTRIIEYLEILKIANLHQRKAATVEWLVKCSENKFTRWEGAYELARKAGFSFYYDRSTDPKFYKQLSKSQLQRLDAAFFATDTIGYNELCLANLVSKKSSQRLKNHLLHNLAFADYYLAEDIMRKIMDIDPSNELHSIYIEARNISYNDKEKEAKQKVFLAKFISAASKQ
jgi:DNA-directed RNA polymerase subunit F